MSILHFDKRTLLEIVEHETPVLNRDRDGREVYKQ